MRKGFRGSSGGDGSTSTINQRKTDGADSCMETTHSLAGSPFLNSAPSGRETRATLEEMILQLEFEEKMGRKAKLEEYGKTRRRMSCVNNSDICRLAKNELNQYSRFSLDGKDAMYRTSFKNLPPVSARGEKPISGNRVLTKELMSKEDLNLSGLRKGTPYLPTILAGEKVVWCKPGVIAKLMGLEAIPIPVHNSYARKEKFSSTIKMPKQLRDGADQRLAMERRNTLQI
ncbi:hypothetical protein U1Q18_017355 [Sarracenia purpurea var. burkii]